MNTGDGGTHYSQQQINKITVHPQIPLVITAHENKQIRFFDINSSKHLPLVHELVKCVKQVVAHTDAVTSLKAKDFTLISGGHDGAIRFWDIRKMQLLYELPVGVYLFTCLERADSQKEVRRER